MSGLTTAKVLIILTSQGTIGNTEQPTGLWFEELSTPYYILQDAGVQIDMVSIKGGEVPIDPRSFKKEESKNPESVNRFVKDPIAMAKIKTTISVDNIKTEGYDVVFIPGGHGTAWDLPTSQGFKQAVENAWAKHKIVASVCHGVAGLANIKDQNGNFLVKGKNVTGFSNAEEKGGENSVPFLLETRLRDLGANYSSTDKFQPYAIKDGNLITGQNPASSADVAKLILQALQEKNKGK